MLGENSEHVANIRAEAVEWFRAWQALEPEERIDDSTLEERQALGSALKACSITTKRLVSPMLEYILVQQRLCEVFRSVVSKDEVLYEVWGPDENDWWDSLQETLKALGDEGLVRLPTRHEDWVDEFREQVDYIPGEAKAKRVINEIEAAELLNLAKEMKQSGNNHFQEYGYAGAVTNYVQITQLLKDVEGVDADVDSIIVNMMHLANRNLSIAALKNEEWNRSRRACDHVLGREPDDYVVRVRRAETYRQLGRFGEAEEDLKHVLASPLEPSHEYVRRARTDLKRLRKALRENTKQLQASMARGLNKKVFSERREEEVTPPPPAPRQHPFFERAAAKAKEDAEKKQGDTVVATDGDPGTETSHTPSTVISGGMNGTEVADTTMGPEDEELDE